MKNPINRERSEKLRRHHGPASPDHKDRPSLLCSAPSRVCCGESLRSAQREDIADTSALLALLSKGGHEQPGQEPLIAEMIHHGRSLRRCILQLPVPAGWC